MTPVPIAYTDKNVSTPSTSSSASFGDIAAGNVQEFLQHFAVEGGEGEGEGEDQNVHSISFIPWNPTNSHEYAVVSSSQATGCHASRSVSAAEVEVEEEQQQPLNSDNCCWLEEDGNGGGIVTENLAQSLQESLDLLLTSPFFSSFSGSADDVAAPFVDISPEQEAMYLEEIFPANFDIMEVTGRQTGTDYSTVHDDGESDTAPVYGPFYVSELAIPEIQPAKTLAAPSAASDVLQGVFTESTPEPTGIPTSPSMNPSTTETTSPQQTAVVKLTPPEPRVKRKGLTAWEQYQKRQAKLLHPNRNAIPKKKIPGEKLSRKSYSVQYKLRMVERYGNFVLQQTSEPNNNVTLNDFCRRHHLDVKMLKTWVMTYDTMKGLALSCLDKKRVRQCQPVSPQLEQLVLNWIRAQPSTERELDQEDVQTCAKKMAAQLEMPDFRASRGWLKTFMKRNALALRGRRESHRLRRGSAAVVDLPCSGSAPHAVPFF
ncbi:hypothetical protein BV898_01788 [Hypsibius exemplaris]|uniref:HTH CENPB-type domain-containing protein n=1 Tax=Hypsibius exemplaris TaxID=2072580 RepID=A0A1W0X9P6_HYPEX|nr:hypothetical protein BV898_01788 [Hypsibius exemplaris]